MSLLSMVNATDLVRWASTRDAQGRLPELLRRLILASSAKATRVHFRSGEGVQLEGWDGSVECAEGTAFVPEGSSAWEMGVKARVKVKANGDYTKRTSDALGLDTSRSSFVFVTPRRWAEKEAWSLERLAEGKWKSVVVYDADDLCGWLEATPSVHAWLSALLGKPTEGVEDLEAWWDAWSNVTTPATTPNIVTVGRDEVASAVRKWLTGPPATFCLKAETIDEGIAFLAATIQETPGDKRVEWFSRTLVVSEQNAWRALLSTRCPLILVPQLDDQSRVTAAVSKGCHVLTLLDASDVVPPGTHVLPTRKRKELLGALKEMGIAPSALEQMSTRARVSLGALRRAVATNPSTILPAWVAPQHRHQLVRALLAGRWDEGKEADKEILATLSGMSYAEYAKCLHQLAAMPDAPIRQVGSMWTVRARRDVWALIAQEITAGDISRLQEAVLTVFGEIDQKFGLPADLQWQSSLHVETLRHSEILREHLAETLAMLAGLSDAFPLKGNQTGRDVASRIVYSLFAQITSAQAWASLGESLPLLAEAAPEVFLNAANKGLQGTSPLFLQLFQDETPIPARSPHVCLLWAFETLARSREHFARAAQLLGLLAAIDPGGSGAERSITSLRGIFLIWRPGTLAARGARLHALDGLRREQPNVAWNLMRELVPERWELASPTSQPRFRDWVVGSELSTWSEIYDWTRELFQRIRDDVGTSGARWLEIMPLLESCPPVEFEQIASRILALDVAKFSQNDREAIRGALRELLGHNRPVPGVDERFNEGQLQALDKCYQHLGPKDLVERFSWLFQTRPTLPQGSPDDAEEEWAAIEKERELAAGEVWRVGGMTSIALLAESSENASFLGSALGRCDIGPDAESEVLCHSLGSTSSKMRAFGAGYLLGHSHAIGAEWLRGLRTSNLWSSWSDTQKAAYFCTLQFAESTWAMVREAGGDVGQLYWENVGIHFRGQLTADDRDRASSELLDRNRLAAAAEVLVLYSRGENSPPPPQLATRLLHAIDTQIESFLESVERGAASTLTFLLDAAASASPRDEQKLARLELRLLPLLRYSRPARVVQEMLARSPEFFVEMLQTIYKAHAGEHVPRTSEQRTQGECFFNILREWSHVPGMSTGAIKVVSRRAHRQAFSRLLMLYHKCTELEAGSVCTNAPRKHFVHGIEASAVQLRADNARICVHNGVASNTTLDSAHTSCASVLGYKIDFDMLLNWVQEAITLATAVDRKEVAETHIGQMLARLPRNGANDWPDREIRDLFEAIQNDGIEHGFSIGVHNARGEVMRAVAEDGIQERRIATRFQALADEYQDLWPRTARIMRELAEHYLQEAVATDIEGQVDEELYN